jgi:Flp pilus assembly protein TadD
VTVGETGNPTGPPGDPVRAWRLVAIASLTVIVASVPVYLLRERLRPAPAAGAGTPTFVGRDKCLPCHKRETDAWRGSDHDNAMAEATPQTVRGDFGDVTFEAHGIASRFYRKDGRYFVRTEGPGGAMADFEIAYTFGWRPLQQYLVRFPGGRLQALHLAWDTERRRWFHLYPNARIPADDWLHWTRNAMNWNGMCAECHSTNLVKGYDPATRTYRTTWSEIDVSCEACHGPASAHVAWAEMPAMARPTLPDAGLVVHTRNLAARDQVELCAPCHSRRSEIGAYDHTQKELLDSFRPALLDEGLYYPDGQIRDEVYEYASFLQSKMYRMGIRCSDCHDVHSLKRYKDGNELCTRCHRADTYDAPEHHFHKKVVDGQPSEGASCVRCHMPRSLYMGVDWRADHSLRVPRPDLTAKIGVPNACTQSGCHADKPLQYSLDAQQRWYGKARKPHYGTILAAGREGRAGAGTSLAQLAGDPLYPTIVRATALSLLGRYPGTEATAAFEKALNDDEALLRHTAASALPALTPEELAARLAPLLFDAVRAVRLEAVARLAGAPDGLLKPYQRERLAATLREYETSTSEALDFAYAGHNLGNLFNQLGQPDRAERYYREAIAVDDLFYPAKVNLAVLLSGRGRNAEAEALLRQVVQAHPEQHEVAYSLALLLAEEKKYDEAAALMRRAAEGMPGHARARYNLGLILQTLGRTEEAERPLADALALEPDNPEYLHALAYSYLQRGDVRRAEPLVARLVQRHPENPVGPQLQQLLERVARGGAAR